VEGTQRPNLPPLPNMPPNVDAIKTIFDTTFASGLDKLLETTWFSKYAFQYLVNDLAFLAQILAYITLIHDRSQYGEEVKLRSQEARITWALLGLCVRPQPRTSHLRCITGRLHAISVMLTGDGAPSGGDVVSEDGEGVDDVDETPQDNPSALRKQERERSHKFWKAVGRVVTNSWNHSARAHRSAQELEAMDTAARQALDECRARLDNRENRDLVYSVLNMRHLSEKWAKDGGEDVTMDGAAESSQVGSIPNDVTTKWNVSRRFIEREAGGRSTSLVLSVIAGMAARAWA
jgi:white-opaque regulator 2